MKVCEACAGGHGLAMVVGCVKGEPRAVCKLGVADGALVER